MPYPPYHRVRSRYPFLERQADEFYARLPTQYPSSVVENYYTWQADLPFVLWSIPLVINLLPRISRLSGQIQVHKEMIYLLDRHEVVVGLSTWNRDQDQRLVTIFKNQDASLVETVHILCRQYGTRRTNRRRNLVPMYALQGIIITPPKDGFASLVARAPAP